MSFNVIILFGLSVFIYLDLNHVYGSVVNKKMLTGLRTLFSTGFTFGARLPRIVAAVFVLNRISRGFVRFTTIVCIVY